MHKYSLVSLALIKIILALFFYKSQIIIFKARCSHCRMFLILNLLNADFKKQGSVIISCWQNLLCFVNTRENYGIHCSAVGTKFILGGRAAHCIPSNLVHCYKGNILQFDNYWGLRRACIVFFSFPILGCACCKAVHIMMAILASVFLKFILIKFGIVKHLL